MSAQDTIADVVREWQPRHETPSDVAAAVLAALAADGYVICTRGRIGNEVIPGVYIPVEETND